MGSRARYVTPVTRTRTVPADTTTTRRRLVTATLLAAVLVLVVAGPSWAQSATADGAFTGHPDASVNAVSLQIPTAGGAVTGSARLVEPTASGCPFSLTASFRGTYDAETGDLEGTATVTESVTSTGLYDAICGLEAYDETTDQRWSAGWSGTRVAGDVGSYGFELTAPQRPVDEPTQPPTTNADPIVHDVLVRPDAPTDADYLQLWADASDPDGDELTYAWVVDGDATGVTTPGIGWSEPAAGTHTARVTVTDGRGGSATSTRSFEVVSASGVPAPTEPVASVEPTEPDGTQSPTTPVTDQPVPPVVPATPTPTAAAPGDATGPPATPGDESVLTTVARHLRDPSSTSSAPDPTALGAIGIGVVLAGGAIVAASGRRPAGDVTLTGPHAQHAAELAHLDQQVAAAQARIADLERRAAELRPRVEALDREYLSWLQRLGDHLGLAQRAQRSEDLMWWAENAIFVSGGALVLAALGAPLAAAGYAGPWAWTTAAVPFKELGLKMGLAAGAAGGVDWIWEKALHATGRHSQDEWRRFREQAARAARQVDRQLRYVAALRERAAAPLRDVGVELHHERHHLAVLRARRDALLHPGQRPPPPTAVAPPPPSTPPTTGEPVPYGRTPWSAPKS